VIEYRAVHQFHSGTAEGDAITNQMLHLQGLLHELGFESEIFAEYIAPGLQNRVRPIHGYPGSESELLLLHHSMGYQAFEDVISLPNDVVVVYHNVTPEQYFDDEGTRLHIRLGREQLMVLGHRALFGVADSNFNRRELLAAGFRRVDVMPVRVDFAEFHGLSTARNGGAGQAGESRGAGGAGGAGDARQAGQAGQAGEADRAGPSTDWLYVGRVIGNKCQRDLVTAFAHYRRTFDREARLVLVGDTRATDYVDKVRAEAERLAVEDHVVMVGKVSDELLRSAFAGAGVFVSMSEHEGFGVPILEAMAAGVPVVAFGAAAVPETMSGAGVLLHTKDPAVVAATVQAVQSDPGMRQRLVERQYARIDQVEAFDTRALLKRIVARASGAAVPLEVQVQGPFETSYSLAVVNRNLALGLNRLPGHAVSIYATEGPGDYEPARADLERHPEAAALFARSGAVPFPDVVIRQMYPPRVIDTPGGITVEYFGWEESRVPESVVWDFNRYLDGVGVMSTFVRDVLRDCGVDIPIRVVGIGVDPPDPEATVEAPELEGLKKFTFLHISSAFPRKGVDVLLEAYFAAFDGRRDVSLVLKTFPNPHNQVGEILDRLRAGHPNPPDVRWIDRDFEDREVQALYGLADCYVHPARGEGFGLPVAEAMAAGVPVITVAYSGLADFVSDETAVTVPVTLEEARTHLGLDDSIWAEPDGKRLVAELLAMVDEAGSPAVRRRVEAARTLIATRFSWEAVVGRWEEFIHDLEETASIQKVAMVTTWNSRCGIAENTRYIVDHSHDVFEFELFADVDAEVIDPLVDLGVSRTWKDRWTPDLTGLEEALRVTDAEVLHVQFNFGFFEFQRLADLLERQMQTRGVVVTLHRTLDYDDRGELLSLRQIAPTLSRVDRLIVHQESDARYLAEIGLSDNVTVVPIGATAPPLISPETVQAGWGLGSRTVVGTFGFLLPHKGTLELVKALDPLRADFPDLLLVAACARYPHIESKVYEEEIRAEIAARGMEDSVLLITEYLPDDIARTLLRGADVIVLPYQETGESSSAALRFILPLGRPVVVTDSPIFNDSRDALLVVPGDAAGLEDGVRRVLMDTELRQELARRSAAAARRFRWPRVIADHQEIYTAARRAGRRRRHELDRLPAPVSS
jgi:glycosyltransferase involved in cell wall biosynthesis